MATASIERLIGKSIKRREDPRFITGRGTYVDDVKLPGTTHAVFVRSPHAHARIKKIDAADTVKVTWDALPAVSATDKADARTSAQIHEVAPSNVAFKWQIGDAGAVDTAFRNAARVVKKKIVNQRLVANPMEPRACLARYDAATGDLTLWVTSQNPHVHRLLMAAFVLGIPEQKVRVISPAVGGGF